MKVTMQLKDRYHEVHTVPKIYKKIKWMLICTKMKNILRILLKATSD